MASLSAPLANWNSQADYKYGDTVLSGGQVWLAVVANPVTGRPPYYSSPAGDWFNVDVNAPNIPRPLPSAITNFRQIAATWDPENSYGSAVVAWEGGEPNRGITTTVAGGYVAFFPEENQNTATIVGIGSAPGFSTTASITALSLTGSGDVNSATITITSLGPPPAPTIALVVSSVDGTTGRGSVAITFTENNLNEFSRADNFEGYAVGSPDAIFTFNRANGTATFEGIIGADNSPPTSYEIYIRGLNSVGEGPISNILIGNFDGTPQPLPDNATNFAVVTFLVNSSADPNTGWSINTNNNPAIGSYDCTTGTFTGPNPIPLLESLQEKGVKVLLSLGGATLNAATAFTNGTQLAQNIAHAFFGVSTGNWVPYGGFQFDGLDLDLESLGPADSSQLTSFVTGFRTLCPLQILSMSPQAPYSASGFPTAFNANGGYTPFSTPQSPISSYIPEGPIAALLDRNYLGYFDYVFIQYYNQGDWNPGGSNFKNTVAQWAKMVSSALPRTRPSPPQPPVLANTRMVFGFASADGVPIYNNTYNTIVANALADARIALNAPSNEYFCAGAGFWNSPTAQLAFETIYNTGSGITGLPADIIYLWLNQSSIDPNWSQLPIFDDETPQPIFPPLQITINEFAVGPAPLNYGGFSVTLVNPPAGIVALNTLISLTPPTSEDNTYLSTVPVNTNVGNTYFISYGLAANTGYRLSVSGLLTTGKTLPTFVNLVNNRQPPVVGAYTLTAINGATDLSPPFDPIPPGQIGVRLIINTNSLVAPSITTQYGVWYSTVPPPVPTQPSNFRLLPLSAINLIKTPIPVTGGFYVDIYFTPPVLEEGLIYYYVTANSQGIWGAACPELSQTLVITP